MNKAFVKESSGDDEDDELGAGALSIPAGASP